MQKRKSISDIASRSKSKRTEADVFNGSMVEALARIGASPEKTGQVIRKELNGTFSVVDMEAIFEDDEDDSFGYLIFGLAPNRKRSVN